MSDSLFQRIRGTPPAAPTAGVEPATSEAPAGSLFARVQKRRPQTGALLPGQPPSSVATPAMPASPGAAAPAGSLFARIHSDRPVTAVPLAPKVSTVPSEAPKMPLPETDPNADFQDVEFAVPYGPTWWKNWYHSVSRVAADDAGSIADSWHSPNWYGKILAVGKTALLPFNIAASAIPSGIMAMFGHTQDSSFFELSRRAAQKIPTTGNAMLDYVPAIATEIAGFGADVVADPLTYITAGAGPLFKSMAKILHGNMIPLVKAGAQATEVARRYRMVGEITPEAISKAAPIHVIQSIAASGPEQLLAKRKIYDMIRTEARHKPVPGITATFEDLVQKARLMSSKDLKQHLPLPESVQPFKPVPASTRKAAKNAPAVIPPAPKVFTEAQQADDLAKHLVAVERHAWEERPLLKAFGKTLPNPIESIRQGKMVPMGSPWGPPARVLSSLQGKWLEHHVPTLPIASMDKHVPTFSVAAREHLVSRGLPHTEKMTLFEFENMFIASQVGPSAVKMMTNLDLKHGGSQYALDAYRKYAKNETQRLITDPMSVKRILRRALLSVAPQDRVADLQRHIDIYKGLRAAANEQKGAIFSRRVSDYDKAIHAAEELQNDQKAMKQILRGPQLPAIRTSIVNKLNHDMGLANNLLKELNDHWTSLSPATTTTDSTVRAFAEATHMRNMPVANAAAVQSGRNIAKADALKTLPDLFASINEHTQTLMDLSIPYKYGAQHRQQILDGYNTVQMMRPQMEALKTHLQEFFYRGRKQGHPMDDVWALAKSMNTEGGYTAWKELADSLKLVAPTVLPAAEAQLARKSLIHRIQTLPGNLTPTEVHAAVTALGKVSDDTMGGLIYAMREMGHLRRRIDEDQAILSSLLRPYSDGIQRAEAMVSQMKDFDLERIMADMGQHQAQYELKDFIRNGSLQKLYDRIDSTKEWALTKAGFAPGAFRLLEEVNNGFQGVPNDALGWADKEMGAKIIDTVGKHANGRKLSTDEIIKVNNALGKVLSSERDRFYSHADAAWRSEVITKAHTLVKEGTDELNALLTPRMAKLVLDDVRTLGQKHLKDMADIESKAGKLAWDPERFPVLMEMSAADKDIADHSYEADEIFRSLQPKEKPGELMWQDHFFGGTAERVAWLERTNAQRKINGMAPLDFTPVYNMTALLAHRRYNHLRTAIVNQHISRLQGLLPHYAQFDVHMKLSPTNIKEGWAPITQLGGIFTKMDEAQHWHIPIPLMRYIKNNVGHFDQKESVINYASEVSQAMFRLSVQFNLVHLKNILALAYIARANPRKVYDYLKYAVDHPQPVARPHKLHFLDPIKYALDTHPNMQAAIKDGISHFDPLSNKPVYRRVMEMMGDVPKKNWVEKVQTAQGPFTTLIFDVVDKATRLALYDQFKELGVAGPMAANMANHFMIDYSARFLSPQARMWGHFMFPFFGWRIGNAMVHVPNMLQNPSLYALESEIRDTWNRHQSQTLALGDQEAWAKILTYSYATPFTIGDEGYNAFVMPQLPWYPYLRMAEAARSENPLVSLSAPAAQAVRWNRWYNVLMDLADERRRHELREHPENVLMGTASKQGLFEEWLWGFRPWEKMIRTAAQGRGLTTDMLWDAAESVAPIGRVQYSPAAHKVKPLEDQGLPGDLWQKVRPYLPGGSTD